MRDCSSLRGVQNQLSIMTRRYDRIVSAVEIWCVLLDAPKSVFRHLWTTLSPDECERAGRFATAALAARFVAARGALRVLLAARLGRSPASIAFEYGPAGKPAVAGRPVAFNLSHSGGLAAIAISDAADLLLGIDVEELRAVPDLHDIARRFFAPAEYAALAAVEAPLQTEAFLNCWTRKEAYLKALGDGLRAPLDRFEVTLHPGLPPALRRIDGDAAAAGAWRLHHFAPPEHVGAVAVRGEAEIKPWHMTAWHDLLKSFA
jgi:4'-phosphopantetheinyl transferase